MKRPILLVLSIAVLGCGGPARIEPPAIDPTAAAAAAIEQCDADGDGSLSREECRDCPALAEETFARYDADSDGRLTREEIAGRLQAMLDKRIGLVPAWCDVYLDNQPLSGAAVVLEPEPFLEGMLSQARGTTNARGTAHLSAMDAEGGDDPPGVPPGLYRVRITHPQIDLPARYNTQTTLGMEIAPAERGADNKTFRLSRG